MNNSFARCIDQICGKEISTLVTYKYSVFGGNTVVLEGHKGISCYDSNKIIFQIAKGRLAVVGKNLQLKCLDKNFAVVVGEVCCVEVDK